MLQGLLHLFAPSRCSLCDVLLREAETLCLECHRHLHFLPADFTPHRLKHIWFSRARSAVAYEGKIVQALWALKYGKRFDLVRFFTTLLLRELSAMSGIDMIIPVPLHRKRLVERGYNQAALLVRGLSQYTGIKTDFFSLARKHFHRPQVGQSAEERMKQMDRSFFVPKYREHHIKQKRILLVDDVVTTGATASECARALMMADVASVELLTIARPI